MPTPLELIINVARNSKDNKSHLLDNQLLDEKYPVGNKRVLSLQDKLKLGILHTSKERIKKRKGEVDIASDIVGPALPMRMYDAVKTKEYMKVPKEVRDQVKDIDVYRKEAEVAAETVFKELEIERKKIAEWKAEGVKDVKTGKYNMPLEEYRKSIDLKEDEIKGQLDKYNKELDKAYTEVMGSNKPKEVVWRAEEFVEEVGSGAKLVGGMTAVFTAANPISTAIGTVAGGAGGGLAYTAGYATEKYLPEYHNIELVKIPIPIIEKTSAFPGVTVDMGIEKTSAFPGVEMTNVIPVKAGDVFELGVFTLVTGGVTNVLSKGVTKIKPPKTTVDSYATGAGVTTPEKVVIKYEYHANVKTVSPLGKKVTSIETDPLKPIKQITTIDGDHVVTQVQGTLLKFPEGAKGITTPKKIVSYVKGVKGDSIISKDIKAVVGDVRGEGKTFNELLDKKQIARMPKESEVIVKGADDSLNVFKINKGELVKRRDLLKEVNEKVKGNVDPRSVREVATRRISTEDVISGMDDIKVIAPDEVVVVRQVSQVKSATPKFDEFDSSFGMGIMESSRYEPTLFNRLFGKSKGVRFKDYKSVVGEGYSKSYMEGDILTGYDRSALEVVGSSGSVRTESSLEVMLHKGYLGGDISIVSKDAVGTRFGASSDIKLVDSVGTKFGSSSGGMDLKKLEGMTDIIKKRDSELKLVEKAKSSLSQEVKGITRVESGLAHAKHSDAILESVVKKVKVSSGVAGVKLSLTERRKLINKDADKELDELCGLDLDSKSLGVLKLIQKDKQTDKEDNKLVSSSIISSIQKSDQDQFLKSDLDVDTLPKKRDRKGASVSLPPIVTTQSLPLVLPGFRFKGGSDFESARRPQFVKFHHFNPILNIKDWVFGK